MSRTLIIDDEVWSLKSLIFQMVVGSDCLIEVAAGPAEGLRFLRQAPCPYDLVIVDLEMEKKKPQTTDEASGAEYTDGRLFCRQYRDLLDQKACLVGLAASRDNLEQLSTEPGIDFLLDKGLPPDLACRVLMELCDQRNP